MPFTTIGIAAAVTPTVVKTTFSHYTDRKPRAKKPTARISYDLGLNLILSFLIYASHHTVEELQGFTGQWVPHPTWIRTEDVLIPPASISEAADLLTSQLGDDGLEAIGGRKWWLWRRDDAELKGEFIEMRSDYVVRQRQKKKCRRIMMYIHGGAYFFGSVDEHRYQLQRHARKLQARVFAPRYRLAPGFPFPCGMLDCLAAYVYLLTIHEPEEIIFAGDSAGGGMVLSLLCLLRDQGVPLPAGAVLISPWVDLTHSFPSLSREDGLDYIPAHGFMQKPSQSWPPPNEDELLELARARESAKSSRPSKDTVPSASQRMDTSEDVSYVRKLQPPLSLQLDGKEVFVKDQIQLYTTNQLLTHPLVSPVLQPSLGGLPPLLIMVGGGELLRDEQIYVAHRAADPQRYKLSEHWQNLYDSERKIVNKYKPTPVQLQVWEDLCHVTPTLSFTRPAKFMYRSISQFSAWALSRAQKRAIEIVDDDQSSDGSSVISCGDEIDPKAELRKTDGTSALKLRAQIGKAGDPIPPFKSNMIRQQVDRHGNVHHLAQAGDLPAMQMSADSVGVVKEGPIRKWLVAKQEWDNKYSSTRRKIQKERLTAARSGEAHGLGDNEHPPPSALAGRLHEAATYGRSQKLKKSRGLGMWSSWGWKHDERTVERDEKLQKEETRAEEKEERKNSLPGRAGKAQVTTDGAAALRERSQSQSRIASRHKTVTVQDEGQTEGGRPDVSHIAAETPSTSSHGPIPALSIDPAPPVIDAEAAADEQHSPQMFLPKWKQMSHLKADSKDMSDAGSTYSRASNIISDNASTRAVFSAPGVQRKDSALTPTPTAESKQFDFRSATPRAMQDNLDGYDTPHSRRSLERLQTHQVDLADGQSVHSSLPASTRGVDGSSTPRDLLSRSTSTRAIVQAEGVIDVVGNDDANQYESDLPSAGQVVSDSATALKVVDTANLATPENRPDRRAATGVVQ